MNQARFNLPERVLAKTFVFRLIYGGQAYSYAHDPAFTHVSKSQKYWQEIIDEFYAKYKGMAQWHVRLVQEALETGQYVAPTGRTYLYPRADVANREWFWRPKILNYPVQGLGADLVAIGRVAAWKRLRVARLPVLFQSTVHDSLDIDVKEEYNNRVMKIVKGAVEDIPLNFERLFSVSFDLPLKAEITSGPNLKEQNEGQ